MRRLPALETLFLEDNTRTTRSATNEGLAALVAPLAAARRRRQVRCRRRLVC